MGADFQGESKGISTLEQLSIFENIANMHNIVWLWWRQWNQSLKIKFSEPKQIPLLGHRQLLCLQVLGHQFLGK